MIFQDPMTSLNPTMKSWKQIMEVFIKHQKSQNRCAKKCHRTFETSRDPMPEKRLNQYPHEFSGGMRQRVVDRNCFSLQSKITNCR